MAQRGDAERLAELCVEARRRLAWGGRALHDEAGGLLAAAGLRLDMMAQDYPAAAGRLREVSAILGQAMESVRSVSQELSPSVRRMGMKRALEKLEVHVDYTATTEISPQIAEAVYTAVEAAVEAARAAQATRVDVKVRGAKGITVRVEDDGSAKGRARVLGPARLLAQAAGLHFSIASGKRTIVLLRVYSLRTPTGRRS